MAYDQNPTYEAPRRAYYAQPKQQAPVQQSYGRQAPEPSYPYNQQPSHSYGQSYDPQSYDGQNRSAQALTQDQQPIDSDGYSGGYQRHQRQQQQPQKYHGPAAPQERQYDPRYQQRQGRNPSPQPPHPPPKRQGYQMQPTSQALPQQRADIRNAYAHPSHRNPLVDQQQNADQVYPTRIQVQRPAPKPAPQSQRPQEQPKKMTMEEWKAKERAKLHNDANSLDSLPQDNAFPQFPTKKKERKPDDRSGGASAMSRRSSEEQTRPSTSSSLRGDDHFQHERRPGVGSRDNSYNRDLPRNNGHLEPPSRPSMDHKPFSFEPIAEHPEQQHSSLHHQQRAPSERQPPNGQANSPVHEHQRPANEPQQQPQQQQRRSPRPSTARAPPALQPVDVRQAQRPAYIDHQPLSPVNVPPRPSTAEGMRSPSGPQQVKSPLSQYSYTHALQKYDSGASADSWPPEQQPPPHKRQDTANGRYDGYADPTPPQAPQRQRTRDDEIEEEMPDFDSAAPQQTSSLHKRKQNEAPASAAPAVPALPMQDANKNAQFLPTQKTTFYNQQQSDPFREMAMRKQRPAASNSADSEFAFPNSAPQQYPQQSPHDQFIPQPSIPYRQQAAAVQPPQPSYANELPPRKSMDDARQMPYRGPSQAHRFHPNGRGPGDPYPPPQRLGAERSFSGATVQTVWSDPGQQRVPSAPPLRQGLQLPPGEASNGAPLTQQRSAPSAAEQHRHSNPDALPQHPTPVRPGLMQQGGQQPAKPPPVRNYNPASTPQGAHQRQSSVAATGHPVTHAELDQLRAAVSANPNNNKQALLLARKLVEASSVLSSEGGKADPRTTGKNRENFVLEAHKRIKKLVASGYAEAQFYLAECYGQGSLGLEVDTKEAFNLYQAAAKNGHPQAAYRTAVCCEMGPEEGGGTRRDYGKAVQWYRRAAALGDVAAMYKLGMIQLKGLLGSPKNVGDAVNWLKRAAERADTANPHALHELGTLYEPANTNPEVRNKIIPDESYARELFQQAAALGYKFSQLRLGQAYEYGTLGLSINNRASISWYSKAAAQGEHQAELALSGWYLTGAEGILEQSDTEALLWARKAASSEPPLAKAMFAMGYFSEMGIGCPASVDEARRWYGRAASFKFPKAIERLEELKKSGKNARVAPVNGKLSRKDQKRDEAECTLM